MLLQVVFLGVFTSTDHPRFWIDPNDLNNLGWVIYVFGSKLNRIDQNRSCTGLDLEIWSTFLELFGLTLNTVNIETPSVEIASVETNSIGTS